MRHRPVIYQLPQEVSIGHALCWVIFFSVGSEILGPSQGLLVNIGRLTGLTESLVGKTFPSRLLTQSFNQLIVRRYTPYLKRYLFMHPLFKLTEKGLAAYQPKLYPQL